MTASIVETMEVEHIEFVSAEVFCGTEVSY